jgi:hypothetical protein
MTRGSVLRRSLPRRPAAPFTSFPSPPVGWAAARASGIDCIARLVAAPFGRPRSRPGRRPVLWPPGSVFSLTAFAASQLPLRPPRGRAPRPPRAVAPRLVRSRGSLRRASSAPSLRIAPLRASRSPAPPALRAMGLRGETPALHSLRALPPMRSGRMGPPSGSDAQAAAWRRPTTRVCPRLCEEKCS